MKLAAFQHAMREWIETGNPDVAAHFDKAARPGLDIYLNNYRTQLLHCLEKVFPHTRTWLGETRFYASAREHIMALPPNFWTLDAYPATFAAAAEALFPDDILTVELARLELAIFQTQTASDRTPLTRDLLTHIDWENAALTHASGGQVLRHKSNAAVIWSALTRGDAPPIAETLREPISILLWRCGWVPCFRTVDHDEADLFAAMVEPLPFTTICAMLEARLGAQAAIARAGLLLARWVEDEAVSVVGV